MGAEEICLILQNAEPVYDDLQSPPDQRGPSKPGSAISDEAAQPNAHVELQPKRSKFIEESWTEDQIAEFEERAAIIEYDGQLPREMVEFLAAGKVK